MAEALLRAHLIARGSDARVHSAGTTAWGGGPTANAVEAMLERGLDISAHESRQLTVELVEQADLVLGMTRDHLGRVGRLASDGVERAFLIGELVRLAQDFGTMADDEDVRAWARRIAGERPDRRFIGRGTDEVDDPIGEPLAVYRATAARMDGELGRLARLLAP